MLLKFLPQIFLYWHADFPYFFSHFNFYFVKKFIKIVKLMGRKYISQKEAQAIRDFKYKGGSISYTYGLIWSPIAQFVLKFVPQTIAPNLITLIGSIIHIVGCMALAVQGIGNYVPPWTLFFFGTCVIVYYNLDNMDGKQARRTGSSSPLGMCMDHGLDALGVSFITLGVAMLANVQSETVILFSAQNFVLGSFWMSVWAQYHSNGILLLGKINAVDDGIPFVSFLGYLTFFLGQDFWYTQVFGICTLQTLLVAFIWLAGPIQVIGFSMGQNFTKNVGQAFIHLIHFPFLAASLYCITQFTDWQQQYFFPIYFCTALVIVKDITYMHLCVVTEQKYNQFTFTTLMYIICFPCFILGKVYKGVDIIPDHIFIGIMTVYFVFTYLEYVFTIFNEMADILGIKVFKLPPKKEKLRNV